MHSSNSVSTNQAQQSNSNFNSKKDKSTFHFIEMALSTQIPSDYPKVTVSVDLYLLSTICDVNRSHQPSSMHIVAFVHFLSVFCHDSIE